MESSRKRPLADEGDTLVTKKRILTGANGSPHVNGVAEHDDEGFGEKLEARHIFLRKLYRKEAIYRRMKHYYREHERSQARIQELERRKSTCEAGLAAMSACWAQLVETIRVLVKPDALPEINIRGKEIFDLTAHIQAEPLPDLAAALGDTINVTQALVTKFVQLGGDNQNHVIHSEVFPECQSAQNECVVLQSKINILQARLDDSESQKENFHKALVAAENQLERSRSSTVMAMESRAKDKPSEVSEEKEELQRKPSSPAVSHPAPPVQGNGIHDTTELEILQEQLKNREAKIVDLEREAALLKDEKTILELDAKAPSLEHFSDHPHYKVLLNHASQLEALLTEKHDHINRLTEEYDQLSTSRQEWEESTTTSSNQAIQELRAMLVKRDAENARLREQREQQGAEIHERKQKDAVKYASLHEYKFLSDANTQRLDILQSELSRCKAKLAANAGAEDLMQFFLDGGIDQLQYYESLKEQKGQAESRVAALEQTFAIYQDDHPDIVQHMKAQADALNQLSEVTTQLEKYKRTYGDLSSLPPNVADLAERLRSSEAELERVRLLAKQQSESEGSLFSELEKLSTAWEGLDRQLKSKVFDLNNLEERLMKSGIDKAKSDNKYYAAMRDKEAIETERKNLARTVEKQGKAVERLTEVEQHLKLQVTGLEKEIFVTRKSLEAYSVQLVRFQRENSELQAHLEIERRRFNDLKGKFTERENSLQARKAECRSKEDEYVRFKKDLEKQMSQVKRDSRIETGQTKSQGKDRSSQDAQALVLCSTCRGGPRTTIITKCMHTFCKDCIDARLSTRQRKCPFCQIPFAHSDVHSFYFQ
ncbi:BRE1 E3 ubiquitin ligase-domain-containing protein [Crassisporium funariophilum]|nr:BRE1 E3 ubiquitin ligase-domain-containing protein [Crassisporium funariophilum]